MRWLDPIVNPIVDTTKKASSWIPGIHHHGHRSRGTGSDAGESSPLIDDTSSAAQATEARPASQASRDTSGLSFSQEYHPFDRSKNALIICAVHVVIYLGVAVFAYSYFFEQWGVIDSIYFAVVTFTTIGYGDLSPSSDASRLFTVFFALYGIGILGAFLSILGNAFMEASHRAMADTEARAKKRVLAMFSSSGDSEDEPESKTFCQHLCLTTALELPLIALLLTLTILLGIPVGRSIISSIYFAVITATTIGFGDFHPETTWLRGIYIFYLPFSVSVFGQVLSKIAGVYMTLKEREAEERYLNRSLALKDLAAMDVNDDGKVSWGEFLSFIMVAMDKVDQEEVDEIRTLFLSLDVDGSGFLEKSDLIKLTSQGTTMQLTDSIRRMGVNAAAVNH